jgi:hypothetical protein
MNSTSGNATLIGASASIVSAGICAANGKPIRFKTFFRYGVPVTLAQLTVAALYVGFCTILVKTAKDEPAGCDFAFLSSDFSHRLDYRDGAHADRRCARSRANRR